MMIMIIIMIIMNMIMIMIIMIIMMIMIMIIMIIIIWWCAPTAGECPVECLVLLVELWVECPKGSVVLRVYVVRQLVQHCSDHHLVLAEAFHVVRAQAQRDLLALVLYKQRNCY